MARKVTDKVAGRARAPIQSSKRRPTKRAAGHHCRSQAQLVRMRPLKSGSRKSRQLSRLQKNECRRWESLHELIGSADGKKCHAISPKGLTFEMMIGRANRRIAENDRPLLAESETTLSAPGARAWSGNNYQAGEIRCTEESFRRRELRRQPVPNGVVHGSKECHQMDSLFWMKASAP